MAIDATRLMPSIYRFAFGMLSVIGWTSVAAAQQRPFWPTDPFADYKHAMYERPKLELDLPYEIHLEGLEELWMRALERPDSQLQRMVIDTLAMAHHRGVPGLEDTATRLAELLEQSGTRLDVRRAIAQTLVKLEATQYAEQLADLVRRDGANNA